MIGWLIVAGIVYGSLTPTPLQIPVHEGDKLEHILSYRVLMGWFMQLYTRQSHIQLAVLCVALGIAMEYAQLASGYRDFEYLDMAADAVGVSIAWVLGGGPLCLGCWMASSAAWDNGGDHEAACLFSTVAPLCALIATVRLWWPGLKD